MNKLNKIILIILIYIGLILVSTQSLATIGTTTEKTTRLRRSASAASDVIELISQGSEVEILSEEGEWYQVKHNSEGKNFIGYIRKDLLKVEDLTSKTTTDENTEIKSQDETSNTETIIEGSNCILKAKANVKILPSINSTTLNKINEATSVKVVEIINKWCKIETENITGWILLSRVDNIKGEIEVESVTKENEKEETIKEDTKEEKEEVNEQKAENKKLYVSTETLNVRKEAKNDAKIIKQLSLNDSVELVEKVDDTWSKVTKGETTGYVASKYLSETKTEATSRSLLESRNTENTNEESNSKSEANTKVLQATSNKTNTTGEEIVAYAKQYLGYKYVSGGKGPNYFDCSGFTQYVFKHFGISLSGASSAQVNYGTQVSKSNLQPGDLLIFQGWGTTSIGHVGIYIGENSFIHAANAQKGVIITSLSDSYYSEKYVTARRLI